MNKLRLFLLIFGGLTFLIAIVFFIIGSLKPKVAGLYIDTHPPSTVWINGREMGTTPYRDNSLKPGETLIKLSPDSYQSQLLPYETKVSLVPGVETVIRYDFATSEDRSAGEIISFEKNQGGETSLVAISVPDSVQLTIDGTTRAFTPHKSGAVKPGEHTLKFTSQGYLERAVKIKIFEGFKLTAIVKLAKSDEAVQNPTPVPSPTGPEVKEQVEILSTDIGYLRVRAQPSSTGDEVGKVEPGKRYPLIETDPKSGWYKIEFEPGKQGWVSNQYARKVTTGASITPTPTINSATTSGVTKTPTAVPQP